MGLKRIGGVSLENGLCSSNNCFHRFHRISLPGSQNQGPDRLIHHDERLRPASAEHRRCGNLGRGDVSSPDRLGAPENEKPDDS